jgi:hypothetical protein
LVTKKEFILAGRNGIYSKIEYDFVDFQGGKFHGKRTDSTQSYTKGMAVPVFYKRVVPEKNVGTCCTSWKLRDANGHLIEFG